MNVRALPAPLTFDWRRVGLVLLVTVNAVLLAVTLAAFLFADVAGDWTLYRWAGEAVWTGQLYDVAADAAFRYSPLAAYGFALLAPLGYWGWTTLHFLALLPLPRKLALIALASFPFWHDVYNGNSVTFVVVAAVLALQGSRTAAVVTFALAALIPRPFILPVIVWLLWKRPEWRIMGLATMGVVLLGSIATGQGIEWLMKLPTLGADDIGSIADLGPAQLIGRAWVPIGLVLAALLTWRGRLGLAGLAASPYWLGYYFLIGLLEVIPRSRPAGSPAEPSSSQ